MAFSSSRNEIPEYISETRPEFGAKDNAIRTELVVGLINLSYLRGANQGYPTRNQIPVFNNFLFVVLHCRPIIDTCVLTHAIAYEKCPT